MDKKKTVKILVPVLILVAVAGLWFVKKQSEEKKLEDTKIEAAANEENKDNKDEKAAVSKDMSSETEKKEEKVVAKAKAGEPDFSFEFTEALDFEAMKKHGLPIIADYGSAHCGPCVAMHPALEAVHKAYEGKAFIKYADVWDSQAATSNVPVRVTPTQVLFTAEGKPYVPSEAIMQKYGPTSFTMYSDKKTNAHVLTVHEGMLSEDDMKELLKEMGVKE